MASTEQSSSRLDSLYAGNVALACTAVLSSCTAERNNTYSGACYMLNHRDVILVDLVQAYAAGSHPLCNDNPLSVSNRPAEQHFRCTDDLYVRALVSLLCQFCRAMGFRSASG